MNFLLSRNNSQVGEQPCLIQDPSKIIVAVYPFSKLSKPSTAQGSGSMTTIFLVDDDPLQGQVRKSILERRFASVERAADVAQAFIRVEDSCFADALGLVIVALSRPGLGGPAFVRELTTRLPWMPVLVLGRSGEVAGLYSGENVRFVPRVTDPEDLIALSRQMLEPQLARPA
jgi:CheY-like chemotaxis protein